jgi:serine/threonine-protein kinase
MGSSSGRLRKPADISTEKYRVLAELGEGGMANVYLAVARGPSGFNKLLVLKAIREDLALQPDLLAMFLDEARLAARLSHPNVVQTLEVSELRGRPVIVMEYLDGQTLSNVLDKPECRDMTLAMRLRVLSAALDGLQYIHDLCDFGGTPLQLVHRDVSPHNVFVTYDGQVKLLDFGIAKGIISLARTGTDVIKGKIRYMAPEQMCGEPVDRRADVFSAGVILWEIATGKRIWHGRSEVNVMHAVLNDGVPTPRSVEPSVSAELERICMRALGRSRTDRYETAAALQADIENLLEGMGSRVTPKDVGKYLTKAFAESRSLTSEIIDAELKKPDDPHASASGRFAFPTTLVSLATAGEAGSVEPVAVPLPPRRGWAALGAALAIGTATGGALILHRPAPHAPAASNETAPPEKGLPSAAAPTQSAPGALGEAPAASPAPAPAVRMVHVQLAATPKSASLFLDGSRVDNPFAGTFAADSAPHAVHAEAPGYAAASTDVALDRDVNVVLPLTPAKPAATARRPAAVEPTTPATVASSAPASPTVAAALDAGSYCSPPFYFDAQGIKRLKPECL